MLLTAVFEGAAGFGVLAIWPSHLHHRLGLSLSLAGAVVALFGLGGMLYMVLARSIIRRLAQRTLAILGVCLLGLPALVVAYTPWWPLAAPACLLCGFGFFMFHNVMQLNAATMAPGARGTAVALFASAMYLGQSAGLAAAALLAERFGSAVIISAGGCLLMATGFAFALALQRHSSPSPEKPLPL